MLFNDLYALCRRIVADVVRHRYLDRESNFSSQFRNGCFFEFERFIRIEEIRLFGVLVQPAHLKIVRIANRYKTRAGISVKHFFLIRICIKGHRCSITVIGIEHCLAEIGVVYSREPIIRGVFFFIGRVEVECHPIGHVGVLCTVNLLPKLRVGLPLFNNVCAKRNLVRFPAQIQLRAVCRCFFVVLVLNRTNGNNIFVPIILVHFKYTLIFRLECLQNIRTAIEQRIVARAKLLAAFGKEICLRGEPDIVGHHFKEVRHGLQQRVFYGVIIQSLDPNGGKIGRLTVIILLCASNVVIPGICNL